MNNNVPEVEVNVKEANENNDNDEADNIEGNKDNNKIEINIK